MVEDEKAGRRGRIVVVAGVNGVGKSTVLAKVKEARSDLRVVNYGDEMFALAKRQTLVNTRDEIRKLPLQNQLELQKRAAQNIRELARDENVIVDTHVLVTTPNGYFPGLPRWVVEGLSPDTIVLIEAPPDLVFARRVNDKTRVRSDQDTPQEIKTFMDLARVAAIASAILVGATVKFIQNLEGDPSRAANEIVKLF
jgi:adenylate kinase